MGCYVHHKLLGLARLNLLPTRGSYRGASTRFGLEGKLLISYVLKHEFV